MANPFTPTETYEVTITDPDDGEEWQVTMRVLNAGDRAMLQDQLRVEMREDDDTEVARIPMGTMRLLTVDRAVVRWTLPTPKSTASIASLREELFEQLFDAARFSSDDGSEDEEPESVEEALKVVDPTHAEEEATKLHAVSPATDDAPSS
jgi:hypothetical protein